MFLEEGSHNINVSSIHIVVNLLHRCTPMLNVYSFEILFAGKYFNYDCSRHARHSTSVMADQCAGQWILSVCDIDDVSVALCVHGCVISKFLKDAAKGQ